MQSKKFQNSPIVPKKVGGGTKDFSGSLVCFRVSGRFFLFWLGFGVPSMLWTSLVQVDDAEQMNRKVDRTRLKKITHCKSRVHFQLKCAD